MADVKELSTSADEVGPRASGRASFSPVRIWPALLILAILWGLKSLPWFAEMSMPVFIASMFGPLLCCLLLVLWWLFYSRASVSEKILGIVGLAIAGGVTAAVSDKSIQGFGTVLYGVPVGLTAFAGGMIVLGRIEPYRRTWVALAAALVAFGFWTLVRMDGVWGDFHASCSWRWEPTTEELYLQSAAGREANNTLSDQPLAEPDWPAFRGAARDGSQPGVALATDWTAQGPQQLWRIPIGPGWSSFSVAGERLFTQEQLGDQEATVCLNAETGERLWSYEYPSRFWESVGGAGPRATPTIDQGRLFALGAEGVLHRLDPLNGAVVWQRNLQEDAGRKPPTWGFSSSPLVYRDTVIVYAGGGEKKEKGVLAYDVDTGQPRWSAPTGNHSYSSPQLFPQGDRDLLLMISNDGLTVLNPDDGAVVAEYRWEIGDGYRVIQPLIADATDVLIGSGMGMGTRRVRLGTQGSAMELSEVWTSRALSPDFNDAVLHEGYVYGFDRNIFSCMDVETGQRQWKKGRYGNGQVLLLPDAHQLLVLSETGELVLLRADPHELVELGRYQAIEGKTWNHPVVVRDRVYVRNGQEAACFLLPLLTDASPNL